MLNSNLMVGMKVKMTYGTNSDGYFNPSKRPDIRVGYVTSMRFKNGRGMRYGVFNEFIPNYHGYFVCGEACELLELPKKLWKEPKEGDVSVR